MSFHKLNNNKSLSLDDLVTKKKLKKTEKEAKMEDYAKGKWILKTLVENKMFDLVRLINEWIKELYYKKVFSEDVIHLSFSCLLRVHDVRSKESKLFEDRVFIPLVSIRTLSFNYREFRLKATKKITGWRSPSSGINKIDYMKNSPIKRQDLSGSFVSGRLPYNYFYYNPEWVTRYYLAKNEYLKIHFGRANKSKKKRKKTDTDNQVSTSKPKKRQKFNNGSFGNGGVIFLK